MDPTSYIIHNMFKIHFIDSFTQANATVLKQVRKVVEHGALVLTTDTAEITQEAATVRHHLGESNFLLERVIRGLKTILL